MLPARLEVLRTTTHLVPVEPGLMLDPVKTTGVLATAKDPAAASFSSVMVPAAQLLPALVVVAVKADCEPAKTSAPEASRPIGIAAARVNRRLRVSFIVRCLSGEGLFPCG